MVIHSINFHLSLLAYVPEFRDPSVNTSQHVMGLGWKYHFASAVELFNLHEQISGRGSSYNVPRFAIGNTDFFRFLKEVRSLYLLTPS